jgi:hypothetical protein
MTRAKAKHRSDHLRTSSTEGALPRLASGMRSRLRRDSFTTFSSGSAATWRCSIDKARRTNPAPIAAMAAGRIDASDERDGLEDAVRPPSLDRRDGAAKNKPVPRILRSP